MPPHPGGHQVPATTHTLEMTQLAELNLRLANTRSPVITAGEIGMTGAHPHADPTASLPASATLDKVTWEGSPEFPTIHGHFGGSAKIMSVDLHTAALQEASRRLHLRQRWGI